MLQEMLIPMNPGQPRNPAPAQGLASRIVGAGEMANRVRAYDWASTPLGPIETWSKQLLTIVNLTLCSPSPTRTMWGPDFILIYNDAYRSIPGPRHPAALGKSAKSVYGESWPVVGPLLEHAFATGETLFYERFLVPLPTAHGMQDHYLNYSFNPIFEEGKIAGLFGPLHDVTGEVTAARKLQESEARLNAIYSTTQEYIGLLTPAGIILHCNDASLEFARNTREEVIGLHFADAPWWIHTPGAPEMLRQWIARSAAGETIRSEAALNRPSGETPIFDFSLTPVRDPSGEIIFLIPEGRDITELKHAEAALLQSEKLAAVGRLAASIAHEINNPLESVMNLLYLARQNAVNPETKEFLETADQELRRVSIIANQTLRFHKQLSNPQAIAAADLFSTVLSIHEGRIRNSSIQVHKRMLSLQPVVCFEGDIRQVLNNLVGNAIDAMPTGGRLHIRSRNATHWPTGRPGLVLTVADTGFGMPPEVLRNIFEAFFTTKGIGGTGLGLWVTQEIVERHHGALRVRSSQREGACGTAFTLFLPFEADTR